MRIKQLIIHSNVSKMTSKISPACLRGNYRDSLGEFSNTPYGVFGAERVKGAISCDFILQQCFINNKLQIRTTAVLLSGSK